MLNLLSLKKLSPQQPVGSANSNGGIIVKKLLFLILFSLLTSTEIWAVDISPLPPTRIQSATDVDKDIVETLVNLISGLAATASDLIYMSTPSSVIAMNTNSALLDAQQDLQKTLVTNAENPSKLALTGYLGFATPAVDASNIAATFPIAPLPNSGTLVLGIYDSLDAQLIGGSPSNEASAPETVSKLFNNLMAAKMACMPSPDGKGICSPDIIGLEAGTRQQILQAIFADSSAERYADGDRIYNAELLFSSDDPVIPMLIDQLGQLIGSPDPRPPHLPEPMSKEELKHVQTQIDADLGKSPTTLDSIYTQQQAYSRAFMQLIAAKNLVMNNFSLIHSKRVTQTSIASQGLKDENGQEITTPLQLENYAANRRLTPDYYKEMAGAPPAAIARETLFTLAEIRAQLQQNQLMQERLLATLSVTALGSFREKSSEITNLSQALETQIKMLISGGLGKVNDLKSGTMPNTAIGSQQQ